MFRVSQREGQAGTLTIVVEGRLDETAALAVTREFQDRGVEIGALALELSGVTGIDESGIRLLRALRRGGARLVDCPETILGLTAPGEEEAGP